MKIWAFAIFSLLLSFSLGGSAEQCGSQAGGAVCPEGRCCSKWGYCGCTPDYCGDGCQSQCNPCSNGGDLASIISNSTFHQMLGGCRAKGFYSHDAFLAAAESFPGFGTTGDVATRKREIAAFFGQITNFGNYSYGQCERAIGAYLLNNPEIVGTDPVISFKTAIRFWMTPQPPKPSCHDVIIGNGLLDLVATI